MGALIRLHLYHRPSGDLGPVHATRRREAAADREPAGVAIEAARRASPASARLGSVSGSKTPRSLSSATMTPTRHCGNGAPGPAVMKLLLSTAQPSERSPDRRGRGPSSSPALTWASMLRGSQQGGCQAHQDRVFANAPVGIRVWAASRSAARRPARGGLGTAHCRELRTCRAHPGVTSASPRARRARRGRDGSGGERGSRGPARSPPSSRGSHRSRRSRDREASAS